MWIEISLQIPWYPMVKLIDSYQRGSRGHECWHHHLTVALATRILSKRGKSLLAFRSFHRPLTLAEPHLSCVIDVCWFFRPKYSTLYLSLFSFTTFCTLGNRDKYGSGERITKFNGDSLGTGEGRRKSLRNISGTLSPRGNGADVLVWTLLGAHSVQYFAETQIHHLLIYII